MAGRSGGGSFGGSGNGGGGNDNGGGGTNPGGGNGNGGNGNGGGGGNGSGGNGNGNGNDQNKSKFTTHELDAILAGYGIPPGAFTNLINQAIQNNWSANELVGRIYNSPEFHQMFPGYFRADGSAKFANAAAYLQQKDEYIQAARTYGFKLSDATLANMFRGNVSTQEATDRLAADYQIKSNPVVWQQFQRQLEDAGVKNVSHADLVAFSLGEGPKHWYDIWQKTEIGAGAKMAGVSLGDKGIAQIQKTLTGPTVDQAALATNMSDLAHNLRVNMPLSKIYKFGLTRSDLIAAEFGGPGAEAAKEKLQRTLDTNQEFQQVHRAHMQLQATGNGGAVSVGGQADRAQVQ